MAKRLSGIFTALKMPPAVFYQRCQINNSKKLWENVAIPVLKDFYVKSETKFEVLESKIKDLENGIEKLKNSEGKV